MDRMQNKIDAVNEMNDYINVVVPQVHELLKSGFKRNKGGDFDKRTKDKIKKIAKTTFSITSPILSIV